MKVLKENIKSTFTIKKSKFLCFGFRVNTKDEIKDIINQLKKQYPDASHICYSYILDDATYYYTDGGEPSGSAGKPIYGALISNKLNYTLFAVIRYFGGIKFGPGPLRQTFKNVTLDTLRQSNIKDCAVTDVIEISVPYSNAKNVSNALHHYIFNKKYGKETVRFSLAGERNEILLKLKLLKIKPVLIKEGRLI